MDSEKALGDIRILDLAGPMGLYCTKLLADLGADVIKIEKPGGDPSRWMGPFFHDDPHPEKSLYWFNLNTNKRSITLNLETVDGRKIFKKLLKTADLLIETFPPGYLEKKGLGYSMMKEINPGLIMTSITPFGQTGPYKNYRAYDIVGVAMGGLMFFGGSPEDPPNQPGASQGYHAAGLSASEASLIALHHKDMTGEGQYIDVSMQESVANCLMWTMPFYDLRKAITTRDGRCVTSPRPFPRISMAWYDLFPCKDGWVVGHGVAGAFSGGLEAWDKLIDWMDSEDMAGDLVEDEWRVLAEQLGDAAYLHTLMVSDPEGFTNMVAKKDHIDRIIGNFLMTKTKLEIYDTVQPWRIPTTVIQTIKDVVKDPQLEARQFFVEVEHPELNATVTYPGMPYRLSETPAKIRRRAPLIGEHNQEIYESELGLSPTELAGFKAGGVI